MKKLSLLLSIFLVVFLVIGHPEGDEDVVSWNKTFTSGSADNHEIAYAVAHDSLNNTYVVGQGMNLLSASSNLDWWLKKFYPNGTEDTVNWNITSSSPDDVDDEDIARSVVVDSNDNIYVVGYIRTAGPDWWIRRFNHTGFENTTHWNKTFDGYGGADDDVAYDVGIDSQNSLYVVGTGRHVGDVGGDSGLDWWLKKFFTNGTEDTNSWNLTFRVSSVRADEEALGVAVDSNDNIYVVGYGTNLSNGTSNKDWWVKRFNRTGVENTTHWNKTFNGRYVAGQGLIDVPYDVAVDSQNSVYVIGVSQNISNGSSGDDWWLKKFFTNGSEDLNGWNKTVDWGRSGVAGQGDVANGIAIDAEDNIYVVGYVSSLTTNTYHWLIKKYNRSGTENTTYWNKTFDTGGPNSEAARAVAVLGNNITVVGSGTFDAGGVNNWWIKRFTADTTSPVVTVVSSNASRYAQNNAPFNVTIFEGITRLDAVRFQVSNGSNYFNLTPTNTSGKWHVNINVSTIVEGTHNVTIFVNDTAGNLNRNKIITFVVDRTAPTVSLTKSSDSTSTTLKITVTTTSDANTCTTSRGSVTGSGASQTITASSLNPDHTYSFDVTCQDSVGNSYSVTQSFKTDGVGGGGSAGGGSSGGSSGGSRTSSTTTPETTSDETPVDTTDGSSAGAGSSGTSATRGEEGSAQGTQAGVDAERSESTSSEQAQKEQEISSELSEKSSSAVWIALLVIILIAGAAYYFMKKK